jgi:signal transduction histidine kinase
VTEAVRALGDTMRSASAFIEMSSTRAPGRSRSQHDAYEEERRRIARELHDGIGQQFAELAAELAILSRQLSNHPPPVGEQLLRVTSLASAIGADLRRIAHEFHPRDLEDGGLDIAIGALCLRVARAHAVPIEMAIAKVPALHETSALALYRITQEALSNVVKHSQATEVLVTLTRSNHHVVLIVADNGVGFDHTRGHDANSLGLRSVEERAMAVGGAVTVISRCGEGTIVNARMPLTQPRDDAANQRPLQPAADDSSGGGKVRKTG